eukprot:jgi/Botrbrau1/13282/Bobra.27_2s0005.3
MSSHQFIREVCQYRCWRPFLSIKQFARPPDAFPRQCYQAAHRHIVPQAMREDPRRCRPVAIPGGRMHIGPAIQHLARTEKTCADGLERSVEAEAASRSRQQLDGLLAAAGNVQEGAEGSWMQSLVTFLTATALVLATLFNSSSMALAATAAPPPAGIGRPVLGFVGEEATLKTAVGAAGLEDLLPDEQRTVKLFLENTPSVVNISNIVNARFGPYSMAEQLPQGMGSGFIWDTEGHVVTNFHVIRGAAAIKVTLIDSSTYPAKLLGGDPDKDVAVLKLQAPDNVVSGLKPVTVGTSTNLQVGQRVFAVGNPFGLDHSMTQGIISGLGRELAVPTLRQIPIKNVIQTDAAINPGNSGGVLLDSRGRLIGINTAIADPTGKGTSSGVGFAIPIDTVKGLVDQVLQYGKIVRPVLGITIAPPQTLRQQQMEGVLVLEVQPGSPAEKAGLKGTFRNEIGGVELGDVIVGLQGKPIKLQKDLFAILDECRPGDKVKVQVVRDGKPQTIDIILGGRDLVPVGE